ncbi:DNA polymerase III subunit gamma/tau [Brevibacillus sp. SAFN-007a]|uniref:DNA polymerase III subunit gamma/tau n=1 Tax=Brevibacillus sp. SAFN-007a TaxID=3436862 RepID=UPI003F8140F2
MRRRELLFGFGAGLLVAASIIGLIVPKNEAPQAALSEEEIKRAATALQMVVLTPEEYKQWQEEKKVDIQPAPGAPKAPTAPTSPEVQQTKTPLTDPPKATATSKATAPSGESTAQPAPAAEPSSQSVAPAAPPAKAVAPQSPAAEPAKKTLSFTVPYKATAEGVAATLVKEGILPENNKFVEQLRAMDKLNRIRVGTYQVSLPVSEKEIAQLITTPPKK